MPADMIPVRGTEVDMIEAVEWELHCKIVAGLPALRVLLVVGRVIGIGLLRLGELRIEHLVARPRRRTFENGRIVAEILEMALADQCRRIAGRAQCIDESAGSERQREAVAAHAVHRGHAHRHQGRAVGHADRRRHVKAGEANAARRNGIDMRRLQQGMTGTAEIIGAVLVGDEKQDVGTHAAVTCLLRSRRQIAGFSDQPPSPLKPDALTRRAQRAACALMSAANPGPVSPDTSKPCAASFARRSGSACADLAAFKRLSTTAGGVPARTIRPNQMLLVKSGWPNSANVGTFGRKRDRAALVTAIALSLPSWISDSVD